MTQDNLCDDLAADKAKQDTLVKQITKLQTCVSWKWKVLEGAEVQVKKKLQYLVAEIEVDGKNLSVTVIDVSALQAKLFSPTPVGTVTEEVGSSQGS